MQLFLDDVYKKSLNFDLLQRLHTEFPGDVGCFAVYLLNYITLQPGEAIYIRPNVVHAYLSGGESLVLSSKFDTMNVKDQ